MSQESTATASKDGSSSAPVIGKNLFWDDMRIGLNVVCLGLIALLIVAIFCRFVLPSLVVAILSGIAALVVLAGMKICCSVPEETGVNFIALGAKGCALLCLLVGAAYYFIPGAWTIVGIMAAVFGAAGHLGFAFVLTGASKYLQLSFLQLLTTAYMIAAAVVTIVFLLLLGTGALANPGLRFVVELVIIVLSSFLMCNCVQLSQAIRRGQQDLPMEIAKQPREDEADEESIDDHETASDSQTPPFEEKHVAVFRSEDFKAARAVVYLLTGVFSVGVVLYTIVAFLCVVNW